MTSHQCFLIALGGNMPSFAGSCEQTVRVALQRLSTYGVSVGAVSHFYKTPSFPPGTGPDYVNAAARISHPGDAQEVLETLHRTEAAFGRERLARWGQRTLDIDLLAAGDEVRPDIARYTKWRDLPADDQRRMAPDQLILPHPRMHERAFVLVPLADVAADWMHPVLHKTVAQMRDALAKQALDEVVRL